VKWKKKLPPLSLRFILATRFIVLGDVLAGVVVAALTYHTTKAAGDAVTAGIATSAGALFVTWLSWRRLRGIPEDIRIDHDERDQSPPQ
jgi:hypothetical protein